MFATMKDSYAIQDALESLGIPVSEDEAERLIAPLRSIFADLQKMDALDDSLGTPTPLFHVDPDRESNND